MTTAVEEPIAEPSTETRLSLPSREQMPDEIWGFWLPHLGEWLVAGFSRDTYEVAFNEADAKQFVVDEVGGGTWDEGDLVPVLIWRKGAQ